MRPETGYRGFTYIGQQSPNLLLPGTGFVEDDFSMDLGGWRGGRFGDDSSALHGFIVLFYLFIYFWLCSVFVVAWAFLYLGQATLQV